MTLVRTMITAIRTYVSRNKVNSVDSNRMLGRWKITHDTQVFEKVDNANEDHCGGCSDMRKKYQKMIGNDNFLKTNS